MKEEMELYVRVPEHIIDVAKRIAGHIDVKTETVLAMEVERIIGKIEMPLNRWMKLYEQEEVEKHEGRDLRDNDHRNAGGDRGHDQQDPADTAEGRGAEGGDGGQDSEGTET